MCSFECQQIFGWWFQAQESFLEAIWIKNNHTSERDRKKKRKRKPDKNSIS